MELGGKSPLLVFEDAELDSCVDWILMGILWGSGQVCSATSRVLVQKSVRPLLVEKILAKLKDIRLGPSLPADPEGVYPGQRIGPLVSKGQYDRVWGFIDEAKAEGLSITFGGERPVTGTGDTDLPAGGYYVPPTLIEDPPVTSRVWKEEIFGPVLCLREFSAEEEAVEEANNTEYGLAAAVFSADEARCTRISRQFRSGIVWTNCAQPAFITAPWGGIKNSGFGRELGRWGLEEFTSVKQITSCASGFQFGCY